MQHAAGLSTRVTEVVRARPGISRVELAQALALSPATVSRGVQELVDAQVLIERASTGTVSGRPRVGLEVNAMAAYALAVDIKVRSAEAALVDYSGKVVHRQSVEEPMGDVNRAMQRLPELVATVLQGQGAIADRLIGVGVAITGTWNTAHHALVFSPALPQWHGINLEQPFRMLPGQSLVIDNDSRAAATAELMLGAGKQLQDFIYIYGDFGIGSAIVHQRTIVRGQENLGGGIGHALISTDPDWPVCGGCGRRGCVGAVVNADLIANQIRSGSDRERVLQQVAGYLVPAAANLLNQLCPQALVLGGSLFVKYPELYSLIVQACRKLLLDHILHRVGFVRAELDPDAALIGMASRVFARDIGGLMAHSAERSAN